MTRGQDAMAGLSRSHWFLPKESSTCQLLHAIHAFKPGKACIDSAAAAPGNDLQSPSVNQVRR